MAEAGQSLDPAARNPSYTFTAGTYDIRLTVSNAGGSDNEVKTDYIAAGTPATPPVADFIADKTSGSCTTWDTLHGFVDRNWYSSLELGF